MKKVLITGASSGIGLATAKQLAAKGSQLTLVARNKEKLTEIIQGLHGSGHNMIVADLTNADDLNKLASHVSGGNYDILINNAGAWIYGEFINIPVNEHLTGMHLNMDSLVMLSYSFLKSAKRGDRLVNIASILAHSSLPGASVYAGTKAFVANFTESLWFEYKDRGIGILGFNPGATRSNFHENAGKHTSVFPDLVLSSTEQVATELISAIETSNKPRVVAGWKNRLMLFMFKFISRKAAINIMGKLSPGIDHPQI